ncbi:ser/thr protein phosphatase [Anaeramoeba flamelloides]|uniref:Ser/thr protein phosphatase n=1 Tax=Anaeramoeba flamelloides TaxID=1746091 RepID=A0AAV7YF57_9EUKA|nr:ser/thr protein phosphatase [Anaeramoeba flamelloides]
MSKNEKPNQNQNKNKNKKKNRNTKKTNNNNVNRVDRILLITDTHGHLSLINELIEKHQCDYVLHAGDFGLYDDVHSPNELEERECFLHLIHDHSVPKEILKNIRNKSITGNELRKLCAEKYPFSDLPDYISAKKRFLKPVYFVPGNHEDCSVFRKIKNGEINIENLFLLDENHSYKVGKHFRVFGLGGNLIEQLLFKTFEERAPLNSGKYTMGFDEIGHLINLSDSLREQDPQEKNLNRIFISHVSPGLEPLMRYCAHYLKVNFAISGHMEHRCIETWTEFSTSEPKGGTYKPSTEVCERIKKLVPEKGLTKKMIHGIDKAFKIFNEWPIQRICPFFNTNFINLPDAIDGHAVLISGPKGISFETYTSPRKFPRILRVKPPKKKNNNKSQNTEQNKNKKQN